MFIKTPPKRYSVSRARNGSASISPRPGSILYTGMAYGVAEHSGVYVGNGEVVELQGNGRIRKVSVQEFMNTPLQGRPEELKARFVNMLEDAGRDGLAMLLGAAPLEQLASDCWSIYVSCRNGRAVGSQQVANRALRKIGSRRDYNVIFDNCHQFCSGCLTGDFENSDNFLSMLKDTAQNTLGADDWRVWAR